MGGAAVTLFDARDDDERFSRGIAMDHQLNAASRTLTTLQLEADTATINLKNAQASDHDPRLLIGDFIARVKRFFEMLVQESQYFESQMVGEFAASFAQIDLASKSPTRSLQPVLLTMKRIGRWAEEESTVSNAMRRSFTGVYQEAHAVYNQIAALENRMETELIRGDVAALAGQASTASLSADFSSYADSEFKQANWFRGLAIALMVGVVAYTAWFTVHLGEFEWSSQLFKLLIAIPGLLLAWYLGSEARNHRDNGRRAREWQIRLNTIRTYTAELPEEQRYQIRTEMGLAIFKEPGSIGMPDNAIEASRKMMTELTDLVKAVRAGE